nr:olfactory receptor 80 [Gregopimpla kuwanae]
MLFGPLSFYIAHFLKLACIVFRCKTIKLCMDHVENDWMRIESENDREIMTSNVRVGRGLTILFGAFIYGSGMAYHAIMPLWSGSTINELNQTVRPLVYPGYDIFVESQMSPTYEIIFCTTCVSAFVVYTVTTAACNIAAIFVTHACGQIQIVMSRLESLVDGIDGNGNSRKIQGRISFIIKCHVRVLRLTSNIEVVLREICLVEVVASSMIICLQEYYCMTEWNKGETFAVMTYVIGLISLSFNIFIFCHIGELLQEKWHQIAKTTYMIEWYRLPGKTGLALVMVIAMANFPRKLTAGGMMELSVCSFGNVMKTSFAYLNMLRTIAE